MDLIMIFLGMPIFFFIIGLIAVFVRKNEQDPGDRLEDTQSKVIVGYEVPSVFDTIGLGKRDNKQKDTGRKNTRKR